MQSVPVCLLLALAWPAIGSKLPRLSQANGAIADEEDVNPADLGAVQAYLQELEAAKHAERVKQLKRDKAAVTKKPFKISDELLEELRKPSPSPAPALRRQRSGTSRAPLLDELPMEDNSIDALTKLGSDAGPHQPSSVAVDGAKTRGTAKEADTTRVADKETEDLLRIVSQASDFEHFDEKALPTVSVDMPDVTAGVGSKPEAGRSEVALGFEAVQPEAKSGAEATGIENQLEGLVRREEEEDAEVIVQYIKHNNEEGLQEKIRSMSEHGGKARIHAAALAMQAMGYTDDLVSKWMAAKGSKSDFSQAEKDPPSKISKDIKETDSSSADDAKVLFRLMKQHKQQELRNAVSTLFHYGGSERVKRAQSVLDMWLHKHADLPGPAKLASASPHLPSTPTSPLVKAAASQVKTQKVEKTPPSVKAAVPQSETREKDQLAEVKEELAKADASEMLRLVKNMDTKGLRALFAKLERSVNGDERVKLAKREFDREMGEAQLSSVMASQQDQAEDQQKQKQKEERKASAEVGLKSAKAAKAVALQGQHPASDQAPVPSKHVPETDVKSAIVGILHEQNKQPEQSVLHPDQSTVDATIISKYMKQDNKEALQGVYAEMLAHGGIDRINAALAVVKRQSQQSSEGQDPVRQQSATVGFALQAHQDKEVTGSAQEQTQVDAKMLVRFAENKDEAKLKEYYTNMRKTGLQRVRAAEELAERMTESSRTQQTTPGTVSFALQAHQNGKAVESSSAQARADAEKMVSYLNKKDFEGMQRFYIEMGKTSPERAHAAEVLANSLQEQQPTSATASLISNAHQDAVVAKSSQEQAKEDAEKMVSYFKKKDFAQLQRFYAEMRKTSQERVRAAEALAEQIAG